MEIYKRHHETVIIYDCRSLDSLQIAIDKRIHELEDENPKNLEIKSVSIATAPGYNLGGQYTTWNACITYSYDTDNYE